MSEQTENYSEENFWEKLKNFAIKAGSEVIEKALWLYYAAQRTDTPTWAKTTIYAALGYFILPIDAIPDITPGVGFADDLGALAAAVTACAAYINDEVKTQATQKMKDWFS